MKTYFALQINVLQVTERDGYLWPGVCSWSDIVRSPKFDTIAAAKAAADALLVHLEQKSKDEEAPDNNTTE